MNKHGILMVLAAWGAIGVFFGYVLLIIAWPATIVVTFVVVISWLLYKTGADIGWP